MPISSQFTKNLCIVVMPVNHLKLYLINTNDALADPKLVHISRINEVPARFDKLVQQGVR